MLYPWSGLLCAAERHPQETSPNFFTCPLAEGDHTPKSCPFGEVPNHERKVT